MKNFISILLFSILTLISCGEKQTDNLQEQDFSQEMTSKTHSGIVEERRDAGSYSYLFINENGQKYWIAIPVSDISPGEEIIFSEYMEMKEFKSETLNMTFESVLFVEDARKKGESNMPNPHQMQLGSIPKENVKIDQISDGYTIEELYLKKNDLNNKIVKVKGKVVKANLGIMNRNWFHIQDGSGKDGTHDLTIISTDEVKIGDVVIAEGTLVKDKDFGSGYVYSLVLENSIIRKE